MTTSHGPTSDPTAFVNFFHSGLQDAALWQLSRGCRWLKELKVSWCVQLTDVSFGQVAINRPLIVETNGWSLVTSHWPVTCRLLMCAHPRLLATAR